MTEAVAILVGGGPAPGINGVISAAAIRCLTDGMPSLASSRASSGSCKAK